MKKNVFLFLMIFGVVSCCVLQGCADMYDQSAVWSEKDRKYVPGEFIDGEMIKEIKVSSLQGFQVVRTALRKLQLPIIKEDPDIYHSTVWSKFSSGETIVVRVGVKANFISTVSIRVGESGDKEKSDIILRAIIDEIF